MIHHAADRFAHARRPGSLIDSASAISCWHRPPGLHKTAGRNHRSSTKETAAITGTCSICFEGQLRTVILRSCSEFLLSLLIKIHIHALPCFSSFSSSFSDMIERENFRSYLIIADFFSLLCWRHCLKRYDVLGVKTHYQIIFFVKLDDITSWVLLFPYMRRY
jgi:hypothetical protein